MPADLANAALAWTHEVDPSETYRPADPPKQSSLTSGKIVIGALIRSRPGVTVHEATQPSLGRPVNVRQVADPSHANASLSLIREAQRTASLDHPNIMPVHDLIFDEVSGPMVVMPHIPGRTWSERISSPHAVRTLFGANDLLIWHSNVLLKVARAVSFAHSQRVLHRDLKPANVWVGDLGEVYLTGWGVGLTLDEASSFEPSVDEVVGSPAYMAPEMVVATAGPLSARTDVYQLGGMLFELLSGNVPHPGDTFQQVVRHILFKTPTLPNDVPASLARVCKRALARNPAARHVSVDAFIDDLQRALAERQAWSLAREADARLDDLERLVRRRERATRAEVHLTFGACRMGYEHALNVAPTLPGARLRLERAMELMVRWELSHGDAEAAEQLLSQLQDVPEDLLERIESTRDQRSLDDEQLAQLRRLQHPEDEAREASVRRWIGLTIALVSATTPALLVALPQGSYTTPMWMALGVGLSGTVAFAHSILRRSNLHSKLTSQLMKWSLWSPLSLTVLIATAWAAGAHLDETRALIALGAFLLTGAATCIVDWRLVVATVGYGLTWLIAAQHPESWAPAMMITGLLLSLVTVRIGVDGADTT